MVIKQKPNPITFKNASIIWPNFTGKEGTFNPPGRRVFTIVIDDENVAKSMMEDGWNVKEIKNEEGDVEAWRIEVRVNYESDWPPRIYKIDDDGTNKLLLEQSTIEILDLLRIQYADVIINPYHWKNKNLNTEGITAYVDTMYVVTEKNELDIYWDQKEAETLLNIQSDEE